MAKKVEDYLKEVDYSFKGYVPSADAIKFINFIKLVEGGEPENKSPILHFKMLDNIFSKHKRHAIMVHRGAGKTTLMAEYLFLYIAVFGSIPNFGEVDLAMYVADSAEGGAKNLRKNIEFRYEQSDFLKEYIPTIKFTDNRLEFINKSGKKFIVKMYGGQQNIRGPLALDEVLYTDNGKITMKDVKEGMYVYMPNGKAGKVLGKSKIFYNDMYELVFADGRKLKVNKDHLNPLYYYKEIKVNGKKKRIMTKINIVTEELINKKIKLSSGYKYFTKLIEPVEYSSKALPLDPYLLGLALGDGWLPNNQGIRIGGLKEDIDNYLKYIDKNIYDIYTKEYIERSGKKMKYFYVKGITDILRDLDLMGKHSLNKFIPNIYMFGSVQQRRDLFAGLLDTDGSCSKEGRVSYTTVSKKLAEDVMELGRSLGYKISMSIYKRRKPRNTLYRLHIVGNINPFKLDRKKILFKIPKRFNGFVPLAQINKIDTEPSQCILIDDPEHEFITTGYLATHNTKELGKRPQLCHAKGTIVYTDMGKHKVEDYYKKGDSRFEIGKIISIAGLPFTETVTKEHRYIGINVIKKNNNIYKYTDINWIEAKDLKVNEPIGNQQYIQSYIGKPINKESIKLVANNINNIDIFIKDGYIFRRVIKVIDSGLEEFIPIETPTHVYETDFGLSHNCVLDDLLSDKDAMSPTVLQDVENNINKAITKALHPTRSKIIYIGTPFNQNDPLYRRVESGKWNVSVYPICEKFPCTKEEFKGSWEDRFPYEYVRDEYEEAKALGALDSFYQELMLQIKSDDDRLIKDNEIIFTKVEPKKEYNYYITTDFATSEKKASDYSVISVWAVDKNGKYYLVDGQAIRQTMDKNINDLFEYAKIYKPLQVGVEVTGQQGAFISWIQKEMVEKNVYFSLKEVRPTSNKLSRFMDILPQFKQGKILFGSELKEYFKEEIYNELSNITVKGFKSKHDDFIDTISMLLFMDITYPSNTDNIEGNVTDYLEIGKYEPDKEEIDTIFNDIEYNSIDNYSLGSDYL